MSEIYFWKVISISIILQGGRVGGVVVVGGVGREPTQFSFDTVHEYSPKNSPSLTFNGRRCCSPHVVSKHHSQWRLLCQCGYRCRSGRLWVRLQGACGTHVTNNNCFTCHVVNSLLNTQLYIGFHRDYKRDIFPQKWEAESYWGGKNWLISWIREHV